MKKSSKIGTDVKILYAEIKRLDDLMAAESRRVNEQSALRAEYSDRLRVAETARLDAIRVVDVNAVSVANEKAAQQAVVLATQLAGSSDTLRSLVAAASAATSQQISQLSVQLSDRLSLLEKAQYENKGRSGVSDPQLAEWIKEMKLMRDNLTEKKGSSAGARELYGWLIGGISLIAVIIMAIMAFKH